MKKMYALLMCMTGRDSASFAQTEAGFNTEAAAKAHVDRGVAHAAKQEYDKAIANYTDAIRLDPYLAEAYNNRGGAYYIKEDYGKAIADYTETIRLNPNNAKMYVNRGLAYCKEGEYYKTIADFTEAIRPKPNDANEVDVYFKQDILHTIKKDYANARADWEKALQLEPNNTRAKENLEVLRGMGY